VQPLEELVQVRDEYIAMMTQIESMLSGAIADYFADEHLRATQLETWVLGTMTLGPKIRIARAIVAALDGEHFHDLPERLDTANRLRNILAHRFNSASWANRSGDAVYVFPSLDKSGQPDELRLSLRQLKTALQDVTGLVSVVEQFAESIRDI
jgi:hypothetical protein